uniref:Surface carbohydrate biosynthesis protein n=1 Tax=Candidatus Kentrum sp. FM TaxID=2126340 RepID=A0A450W7H0_9GAMM|nr:MAG: surface carbohydrate biosynthesis protein [Candidatus Kentron sp. FM]VFJ56172.1 MAG: surface carbohydrate biosynthesis protein [Candidatus Kentron sp. FM]VFK12938.1 MAG: surface carbohydrate biosynthesis protein [Candidatus Kentron sp. FM]
MRTIVKRWLLIPIEIKPREYRSRLLLAMGAVKKGCGVIIGRQGNLQANLSRYPAGVYFDKSFDGDKAEWFRENIAARNHMILAGNDEEGLASEGNEWIYIHQRHAEEVLGMVRYFFAWGEKEAELIRDRFPTAAEKILATGNPRVDIWKSDCKEIYRPIAQRYRRRFGPYILMPSSFAGARYGLGQDFIEKEAIRRGILDTETGRRRAANGKVFVHESLRRFEEIAVMIAHEFRDHHVIIRPHPAENIQACAEFARGISNIKVILDGEVTPWILGSRAVVHSFCTTGLEAFLMRHPVIAYRSLEGYSYANFLSNRVGIVEKTPEEVIASLREVLRGNYPEDRIWESGRREIADNISTLGDGEFAYRKIVERLVSIEAWKEAPLELRMAPKVIESRERIRQRLRKRLLGRQPFIWTDSPYFRQKFPGLTARELKRDIEDLSKHTGLPVPRHVVKVNEVVFAMY